MALSVALELIGGAPFELFSGSVTRALDRKAAFRYLLQDIKHTLSSLRRQARVIQQIQEYNLELSLPNDEIIALGEQLSVGRNLVDSLSGIKFRLWNFCCTNDYEDQLRDLNRALESLFDTLQLEQLRDIKEILKLQRENNDMGKYFKAVAEKLMSQKRDDLDLDPEVMSLLKKLVEQNAGNLVETSTSTSASTSGSNTEDGGNNDTTQVASLEGLLEIAFQVLFDDVTEVLQESTLIFRPLLKRLKSTLDCLRPFIEDMVQPNKILDRPKGELEIMGTQVKNGVELVRKFRTVRRWTRSKKYRYTNNFFELNEFLQGILSALTVEVAKDVRETTDLIRNIQNVFKRIGGSDMIQNQLGIQGLYDIPEPPIPPVRFEVPNMPETQNLVDKLVSARDIEAEVNLIENTVLPLEPETMPNFPEISNMKPSTVGLDAPLRELKRKLLKDGESVLVLTGPDGCGKSTLAKQFCEDEEVKDIFKDNIFFVEEVSKTSDSELIAQQILCQLNDCKVPRVQNKVTAVKCLEHFLKEEGKKRFLLVLDDVWDGRNFFFDECDELSKFKILMISSENLSAMNYRSSRFGSTYYLNALSEEDAMTLFRRSAFLEDKSSSIPEDLLKKIVQYCKGNPLALKVTGKSLCGMPLEIWEKRVQEWSKGDTDVFSSLKVGYDALAGNSVLKESFLDLSLFPKYQTISADALIDIWAELYGVHEDQSIMNLHELTARGLAKLVGTRKENVEMDGYYSKLSFTMHDIIRDVAIHLASQEPKEQRKRLDIEILGGKLPDWLIYEGPKQKYQPMKARLVFISTDEVSSLKWHNVQLPEAEVLVLYFQTGNCALPEFVKNMGKLKALIITSCSLPASWSVGFLPAGVSNIQLLASLPDLTRIRLERISIASMNMRFIQLKSLRKISLFKCHIGQSFSNTSIQFSDAFPNLVETKIDHCNDLVELPSICDLANLEKLTLMNCPRLISLPMEIGKLTNLRLLRLNSCTDLEMLPDSLSKLVNLRYLDLSECSSIRVLPEFIGELRSLKTINMRKCSKLQTLPLSVLNLQQLQEVICDKETEKLWKPFQPNLKNMRIKFRLPKLQF